MLRLLPGVRNKVVDGDVDRFPPLDVPQGGDYEVVVKCICAEGKSTKQKLQSRPPRGPVARRAEGRTWVVEVELALEGLGLLLRGEDPVEAVLAEDGHLALVVVDLVLAQQLHDLTAHRRLNTSHFTAPYIFALSQHSFTLEVTNSRNSLAANR